MSSTEAVPPSTVGAGRYTLGDLIGRGIQVLGSLTGRPIENEENLAFSLREGVRPVIEQVPLEQAASAFARMQSGHARFRMVLVP